MYVNGYNMAAEMVVFLIVAMLIILMMASRPKITPLLKVMVTGFVAAEINIVFEVLCITRSDDYMYVQSTDYFVIMIIYYVSYLVSILCTFSYINLLSQKRREQISQMTYMLVLFSGIYILVVLYYILTNQVIDLVNGVGVLTKYYQTNLNFGIVAQLCTIVAIIINRKYMPKIIVKFSMFFALIIIALLIVQMIIPKNLIMSVTMVGPLMLYYVMFHSIRYDEVTGCQDKASFESHIAINMMLKKKFYTVFIEFPRMKYVEQRDIKSEMQKLIADACCSIERMTIGARVYMINDYTFAAVFKVKNDEEARMYLHKISAYMESILHSWKMTFRPEYRMVAFRENINFKKPENIYGYVDYLFSQLAISDSRCYVAVDGDFDEAERRHRIEQQLLDIRNKGNLNDPRVIVYVQPIYDLKTQTFRTAEALMRLRIDGRMVFPDTFIPIAEKNGCIHALTRIVLNKVCKEVYRMNKEYSFDAISVNCSTAEFSDKNLHKELIDIIKSNKILTSNIRLELTESMMFDDYETVLFNMNKLNEAGVSFYLDDFGTGYSNMERIISLPFSTIKFDKSMLHKAIENDTLNQLVDSMVSVFKKHNLVLLMEGVEDEEQALYTKQCGFDYIQGYYYAKPVPLEEVRKYFNKIKGDLNG